MSVNISPRQLLEPDLVEDVRRVLMETGLNPTKQTLEITEGALISLKNQGDPLREPKGAEQCKKMRGATEEGSLSGRSSLGWSA